MTSGHEKGLPRDRRPLCPSGTDANSAQRILEPTAAVVALVMAGGAVLVIVSIRQTAVVEVVAVLGTIGGRVA